MMGAVKNFYHDDICAAGMAAEFEPVTYREMSYVLTEADVFDGKNKLGMDVSKVPLNVLLCKGCDEPINYHICPNCEIVFTDGDQLTETVSDPLPHLEPTESASDWLMRVGPIAKRLNAESKRDR